MVKSKVKPAETWVIVNDTQVPFHHPAAVKLASELIGYVKPDHIIYNGDIADFWSISKHNKSRSEILSMIDFQEEIDRTIQVQDIISRNSKKSKLHMVDGNHEERLNRFLGDGPQYVLGSLKSLSIPEVFNYEKRGWSTYHPYGQGIWIADNLYVYHGTAVNSVPGVSVQKEIEALGASVLIGHVHRRADVRFRRGKSELRGIENGCLCQFSPSYKLMTNWTHCLTIVEVYDNKHWRSETVDFIHDNEANMVYCIYRDNKIAINLDYDDGLSLPWNPDKVIDWEDHS